MATAVDRRPDGQSGRQGRQAQRRPYDFLTTEDAALVGALALITVANSLGDSLLRKRWRRLTGVRSSFLRDYTGAVRAVLTGRMPTTVVVHALFAGVVYFAALASCGAASTS